MQRCQRLNAGSVAQQMLDIAHDPRWSPLDLRLPGQVHLDVAEFTPEADRPPRSARWSAPGLSGHPCCRGALVTCACSGGCGGEGGGLECGAERRRNPEASVLHQAVREGWPKVVAAAESRGGLPKRVHEEVRRYLRCGVLRWGFTLVKCETCQESVLIGFSCKSRGWCPPCAARRAHEAAAHLERVLPPVAYRQWTLSVPSQLRWPLVKDVKLLRSVERCLVKAIFRWQRLRAKGLGVVDGKPAGWSRQLRAVVQRPPRAPATPAPLGGGGCVEWRGIRGAAATGR